MLDMEYGTYWEHEIFVNCQENIGNKQNLGMLQQVVVGDIDYENCYDPLDPNGNITVTFDIHECSDSGYVARVTIQNYYQYRHVDKPGWQLGWTWAQKEVILTMGGAFATLQGDCSNFKYQTPIPHCCKQDPVIMDLTPDAAPENRSEDCCRSGLLAAWAINPSMSFSSFEINVGNLDWNNVQPPQNLSLMAPGPGYTCGQLVDTDPTVSSAIGGKRHVQVFKTWKSTCTYSSFLANKKPVCCASLSTFYNPTITPCPKCSCGCREADQSTVSCISDDHTLTQSEIVNSLDMVQCTDHMCPVRIHWHIKNNYRDHWRVKLTVTNYNYAKNYSDWNVLVQHPGLSQPARIYSFNSTMLPTVGIAVMGPLAEEVALLWGIENYNQALLRADEKQVGSVTTEILLAKDSDSFTLRNGWAFPRRIYFDAHYLLGID
ncbi:hypothetical protein L1049_015651 [Liquidambar formosana]|uniref:COBRA-like protein n=1 Tax=Liquidambar formosana TaxID=63359 RepID=A0AAP0RY87_LIQFO